MRYVFIALIPFFASNLVLADDSSATLKAGSIVFTNNTPVHMVSEDLYISPKTVRIRFEFVNNTAQDINTIVAFPLPDIDTGDFWEGIIGTTIDDPVNFVGFKAVVNGKPVAFKVEQRAFIKDKDVTALITSAELPINPVVSKAAYMKFEKLPLAERKFLADAGVAVNETGYFAPRWIVRTKFYWSQRFPAHKTVIIEHSYQPVTGEQNMASPGNEDDIIEYCINPDARKVINRNAAKSDTAANYQTDYILKTATNWQGSIGRFHLTLDKLKADNVLSLCWDGELKQTSTTTFEFTQNNYVPTRDIHMIVWDWHLSKHN